MRSIFTRSFARSFSFSSYPSVPLGASLQSLMSPLRTVFTLSGRKPWETLQLPRVVVIGAASSGKTGVIEALLGRTFVPVSASGHTVIATVTPTAGNDEWALIPHAPGKRFALSELVRSEPNSQKIAFVDLRLKTAAPLVLAEIPLAKAAGMINDHSDVILVVHAANAVATATATSDALGVAKKCDPTGKRTIGVLTKIDLAGSSVETIASRMAPLKLGWVGVCAREHEQRSSDANIGALMARIDALMTDHVRTRLWQAKGTIDALEVEARKTLAIIDTPAAQFVHAVERFAETFVGSVGQVLAGVQLGARSGEVALMLEKAADKEILDATRTDGHLRQIVESLSVVALRPLVAACVAGLTAKVRQLAAAVAEQDSFLGNDAELRQHVVEAATRAAKCDAVASSLEMYVDGVWSSVSGLAEQLSAIAAVSRATTAPDKQTADDVRKRLLAAVDTVVLAVSNNAPGLLALLQREALLNAPKAIRSELSKRASEFKSSDALAELLRSKVERQLTAVADARRAIEKFTG